MYFGKDETYKLILIELDKALRKADLDLEKPHLFAEIEALVKALVDLLVYLDKKEDRKCEPTMD